MIGCSQILVRQRVLTFLLAHKWCGLFKKFEEPLTKDHNVNIDAFKSWSPPITRKGSSKNIKIDCSQKKKKQEQIASYKLSRI